MAEKKHTKEELLKLLDCKLKKAKNDSKNYDYILLIGNCREWWVTIRYGTIWKLNPGYCIDASNLPLLSELIVILNEEEKQKK